MQINKTPVLECEWAKLLEPARQFDESKPDAWSVDLLVPVGSPELDQLEIDMEQLFQDTHGAGKRRSPHWSPIRDHKERKDVMVLRLKLEARTWESRRPGGGTRTTEPPRIMDSRQNPWPADTLIGNGSKLKVGYSWYGWEAKGAYGISIQPRIVMVVNHVPYTGGLDSFDMGIEEGGTVVSSGFDQGAEKKAEVPFQQEEIDDEEIPF